MISFSSYLNDMSVEWTGYEVEIEINGESFWLDEEEVETLIDFLQNGNRMGIEELPVADEQYED